MRCFSSGRASWVVLSKAFSDAVFYANVCANVSETVAMALPYQSCAAVSETVAMALPC